MEINLYIYTVCHNMADKTGFLSIVKVAARAK